METQPLEIKNVWQLLYWIYFKPFTLRQYVRTIDANLDEDLKLWEVTPQARQDLRLKNIFYLKLQLYTIGATAALLLLTGLSILFPKLFVQLFVGIGLILSYFTLNSLLEYGYLNQSQIPRLLWTGVCSIFPGLIALLLYSILPSPYDSVALGVAFGVALSVALSVAGGVAFGVAFGVAGGVAGGVALGVVGGVAGGVAFGVAFGVALIISFLRLPIYSLELLWTSWLGLNLSQPSKPIRMMWEYHPLQHDEVIQLPLLFHDRFIADLAKVDHVIANEALILTAGSKAQTWAVPRAVAKILEQKMGSVKTPQTMSRFYERTEWIPVDEVLNDDVARFIQEIRDISHHVEGALQNNTEEAAENSLVQVIKTIDSLRAQLSRKEYRDLQPLGIYLQQWHEILEKESKRLQVRRNERGLLPQRYIAGNPLEEGSKVFRGRDDLFQQLEELVVNTPVKISPLLLGQPRTGKTSVLKQFPSRLGSGIISVYMDLEGDTNVETIDAFFLQIANRIHHAIQRQRPDSGIFTIDTEQLKTQPYITFQNWLEGIEAIFIEQDLWLFLTLDEFYKMDEAVKAGRIDERIFNWIRTTLQQRQRVVIALCGTFDLSECDPRWYEALKNVQTLPVSYLRQEDARRVFVQPAPDFPATVYTDEAIAEVLKITGSQPYFIHLLGQLLVEGYNKTRYEMPLNSPSTLPITLEHVHGIIPLVYERGNNFFESFWRSWLLKIAAPHETEAAALLPAIARGNSPATPSIAKTHLLNLYHKRDLLTKQANGTYTYQVPLIGRWIAEHK